MKETSTAANKKSTPTAEKEKKRKYRKKKHSLDSLAFLSFVSCIDTKFETPVYKYLGFH